MAVATSGGLYTFNRNGRLRTFASLDSFAFDRPPVASTDLAGYVWLLGATKDGTLVAKLAGGTVEVFRWRAPGNVSLLPLFFGPDVLTYLGGVRYMLLGGVRLRGGGFGPDSPIPVTPGVDQTFPTSLGGLQVQVNGIPAPILSAARDEVVFAIPFSTPEGDAVPVSVQDQGQRSAPLPIAVRTIFPQIVSILNEDGKPNSDRAPASPGSTVTLLFTGLGPYTPPLAEGQIAPSDSRRRLAQPVTLTIQTGPQISGPGNILYAGLAPGTIGQAEIKVQLPPARPSFPGSVDAATLTFGSVTVYLNISVQ